MRQASEITKSLRNKLPTGFALAKRGGVVDALFASFAAALAPAEAESSSLFDEFNPRQAVQLLEDFERVLGRDPCGRDTDDQTIDQRQRIAHQRWTATGGQSIAYYLQIAKNLGSDDIIIEEFWPSTSGVLVSGERLVAEGEQFVWRVNLKLFNETRFIAGANRANDRLFDFELSGLDCVLRRLKPAHTTLIFSYRE